MDQETGKTLPFDTVHEHIRQYIYARSMRTGINQYIDMLAGKAKIVGFEFGGPESV